MNTSSAKNKGRALENFVVQKLRQSGLDPRASRNPGSGSGLQKGDVWNSLGFTIECKNTRKAPGKAEYAQVEREAMGYSIGILIWHPPAVSLEDSRVIMNINDWLDLVKKSKDKPNIEMPGKDLAYKLRNARRAFMELEKELKN